MVSLPDHHFLGPGNTVSNVKPVDTDDHIALDHDIAYDRAKVPEDIRKADEKSAGEFLTDVIENQNPHSVIGYIGLKTKQKVEEIVGVQYPKLSPTLSGMPREPKYPVYEDPSEQPYFPRPTGQRSYVWSQWNAARQRLNLPRVDPPEYLHIGVTQRPPMNRHTGQRPSSYSISYDTWTKTKKGHEGEGGSGPIIDALNRQRTHAFLNSAVGVPMTDSETAEVHDIVRQIQGGSISLADFDDADGAGPSSAPDPPVVPKPPTSMPKGTKRPADGGQGGPPPPPRPGPAPAAPVAAGAGHNSSSDGGFDSAQGPISYLMKGGYEVEAGVMRFSKVHRIKSWAIPYWNLASATFRNGANLVTTPLVKIPWEYAFFYLSPEDFQLIPAGSFIESVAIQVNQIVAQTGFPTGSTEANIATTNHPKVICIGHDLEALCRGGVDRALDLTNAMIPSLRTDPSTAAIYDDFIAKQYGTDQTATTVVVPGCATKIPWYNQCHFCIYQPNRAQAKARGMFVESGTPATVTENYAPGFEYFQNYITEHNSNDTTWDLVDSQVYNFENAPIGEQFRQLELLTDDFNQATGNATYYNSKRGVTNMAVHGNTAITETFVPSSRNTLPIVTYKSSPIEKGACYVRGDAAGKPCRQPSYHIGMRAIEKASPSSNVSRASTFVQASIEFEIKAVMVVKLPSYPNRFIRPKEYTTSIENAAMGIGTYPAYDDSKFVTFGLLNETATAPAVNSADQVGDEPTEDGVSLRRLSGRPRRSLPRAASASVRKPKVSAAATST